MNDHELNALAQQTADDILERNDRHTLRRAIARLARQGIEIARRLYLAEQQQPPPEWHPPQHG